MEQANSIGKNIERCGDNALEIFLSFLFVGIALPELTKLMIDNFSGKQLPYEKREIICKSISRKFIECTPPQYIIKINKGQYSECCIKIQGILPGFRIYEFYIANSVEDTNITIPSLTIDGVMAQIKTYELAVFE